jgi:tRNA nucleotidyltransferase (CCA-adding enzyme)
MVGSQNHPMLTMMPDESSHFGAVRDELVRTVQREMGAYEVHTFGSFEKQTGIPGQVDIDIEFKISPSFNTGIGC